jgi:hypothetical protein
MVSSNCKLIILSGNWILQHFCKNGDQMFSMIANQWSCNLKQDLFQVVTAVAAEFCVGGGGCRLSLYDEYGLDNNRHTIGDPDVFTVAVSRLLRHM